MDRRSFLKIALAGTGLAATWQPAAATGLLPKLLPGESVESAPKPLAPSMKGIVTDNENPTVVNSLCPDWMEIEFGEWCWNQDHKYNCKWALHLFNQTAAASDIQQAMQHPSYDGWWLIFNEPDLEKMTAGQAVKQAAQQMNAVLAVDPNAKFAFGGGSQLHAPFTSSAWLPKVWQKLPANLKTKVKAFHTHYYPQSEFGDSPQIFSTAPIKAYLTAWRNWMKQNAADQPRQLWVTEIGLIQTNFTRADPRTVLYPVLIQAAMNGLAERWAWYSESTTDGYTTLCEPAGSKVTPHGMVFAAIKPGVYPNVSV